MKIFEVSIDNIDKMEFFLTGIRHLIPQLSSSADELTYDDLLDMVKSETTHIFVAEHDDEIIGTLSLVLFKIPTGIRAWIEDVVVDESARGLGAGQALNEYAIEFAKQNGARTIDLTSRPSREAANRLYQRIGFELRESNLYRFKL